MTISMSDADFASLVEAAEWVYVHSGVDAPEYPALERLNWTVDGIAKRRPVLFDDRGHREHRASGSDVRETFA